jgi:uncharacterized membrane protein YkoI
MNTTARTWIKTGAIGLAGLAVGGVLATTVSATAESSGSSGSATQTDSLGSGEEALTADTATKVRDAVLAEYPGATVERLETDDDGVYEAHLTTSDGSRLEVQVNKDFEVTGSQEGGPGHHGGFGPVGPGGPGSGEEPLTGDTATKVRDAALATYPGATVDRLETDADGVYEAHLVKADGTPVTVEVDKTFEVTGEEQGGFGDHDGDVGGPGGAPGAPDGGTDDATTQDSLDTTV